MILQKVKNKKEKSTSLCGLASLRTRENFFLVSWGKQLSLLRVTHLVRLGDMKIINNPKLE